MNKIKRGRQRLAMLMAAIGLVFGSVLVASPAQAAMPPFQMPFPCGQAWHASTYTAHNAIDWNAYPSDNGSVVVASAAGTATLQTQTLGGYMVTIDHGSGWKTVYAHLQQSGRISGTVTAGDVIGYVGSSGTGVTGAHLHWEQLYNNVAQSTLYANGVALTPGTAATSAAPSYTSNNCPTPAPTPPAPRLLDQHVYTGATGGGLYESYWSTTGSGAWGTVSIGSLGSTPTNISSQTAPNGTAHVYSLLASGDVYDTYYNPGNPWGTNLAASLGSGVTALSSQLQSSGMQHIYTGTSAGVLRDTYWSPVTGTWSTNTAGPTLGSGVVALTSQIDSGGGQHIYAATSSGNVYENYWNSSTGVWGSVLLGTVSGGGIVDISSNLGAGGTQYVFYATASGSIGQFYYNPGNPWGQAAIGTVSGTPVGIDSDVTGSGTQRLYTATSTGNVYEAFWPSSSGWTVQLIQSYGVTLVDLTALLDDNGTQHVYTVDSSGTHRETWWPDGSTWGSATIGTMIINAATISSGLTLN